MFRNSFKFALILLVFSQIAEAGWQNLFRVSTDVTRIQAPCDSDCPQSIAANDSGNIYTVWEDKREASNKLAIYFRKKGYNGQWEQTDRRISEETDATSLRYRQVSPTPSTLLPKLSIRFRLNIRSQQLYSISSGEKSEHWLM